MIVASLFLFVSFDSQAAIPSGIIFEVSYYSGGPQNFTSEDMYDNSNGKMSLLVDTFEWTDDWVQSPEYLTTVTIGSDNSIYYTLILEIDYGGNYYNQLYFDLRGNNDVQIDYTVDGSMYDLEIDYGNGVMMATFTLVNVPNHRFYILNSNYISNEVKAQFYQEGYSDGYIKGQEDGYEDGFSYGYSNGYISGQLAGYNAGIQDAFDNGFEEYELEPLNSYDYSTIYQYLYDNGFGASDETSFSYVQGYSAGYAQSPSDKLSLVEFIPGILGVLVGFVLQIASVEFMGITLLDLLAAIVTIIGALVIFKIFVGK